MPASDTISLVSGGLRQAVTTSVNSQSSITHGEEVWREGWQRLIDDPLIEWGCNPGQFEDEETPIPSRTTVWSAIQVAQMLRDQPDPTPPPTRIVPDAHGGIVFEHDAGRVFETIRISADGSVEHCWFIDSRMVGREPWQLGNLDSE